MPEKAFIMLEALAFIVKVQAEARPEKGEEERKGGGGGGGGGQAHLLGSRSEGGLVAAVHQMLLPLCAHAENQIRLQGPPEEWILANLLG